MVRCIRADRGKGLLFYFMRAYNDPTADIAIANVTREEIRKKRHSGVARYYQPEKRSGKTIRVNKGEWFYSQFNLALRGRKNGTED